MICPHHGHKMVAYMSFVFEDDKQHNNFIDVFYKCPDEDCLQRKVARYTDEYVFCNIHTINDTKEYCPDMTMRRAKFAYAEDEIDDINTV